MAKDRARAGVQRYRRARPLPGSPGPSRQSPGQRRTLPLGGLGFFSFLFSFFLIGV